MNKELVSKVVTLENTEVYICGLSSLQVTRVCGGDVICLDAFVHDGTLSIGYDGKVVKVEVPNDYCYAELVFEDDLPVFVRCRQNLLLESGIG